MSRVAFEQFDKTTTLKGRALRQLAEAVGYGAKEFATIRLSGNVADNETITISDKKFRIKQINTAMQNLANSALDNTKTGVIPGIVFAGAHGLSVGHVFRVNSEYFKVTEVNSTTQVAALRGYAGSTVAAQASGQAALVAANYTGANLATDIIVPVGATLTPAAAGPLIALAIQTLSPFKITAEYLSTPTHILMHKEAMGNVTAVTEAMANGAVDATFRGGVQIGDVLLSKVVRAPSAQEVTDDYMHFVFPFTVKHAIVAVRVASSNAVKAWDGTVTISGNRVTLSNGGTTDWATTDNVIVEALG